MEYRKKVLAGLIDAYISFWLLAFNINYFCSLYVWFFDTLRGVDVIAGQASNVIVGYEFEKQNFDIILYR